MNNQNTVNRLFNNFRQQGVMRKHPSFFGKALESAPADQMLKVFAAGGLTRSDPSFFGLTVPAFGEEQQFSHRVDLTLGKVFILPKRKGENGELPRAA